MKSQKPIHTKINPDGTSTLHNATGDVIGTIKDPQDADTIVNLVNATGGYSQYGGK